MQSDLEALAQFLRDSSGLTLDAGKHYLVESRLGPLMRAKGFAKLSDLTKALYVGKDAELKRSVVDAMMTNETFFFRDRVPFDNFRDVLLPQLREARAEQRSIRIWCAASSTGQEPYSLAMILDEEMRKFAGWTVEIVATDISSAAIASAREGKYTQFEVQRGLPISNLLRYFRNENDRWQISEHLRAKVQFREFNLLSDFRDLGRFDVIFCRNVLIYFDVATKRDILRRMAGVLAPDGNLIMGSAETVIGLSDELMPNPNLRFAMMHASERTQPSAALKLVNAPPKAGAIKLQNPGLFGL